MNILDIDTEILREGVRTAKQTNDAITEACEKLNQVVIHNDWHCQERVQINENTVMNRETAREIQENSAAFYNAIEQSSAQFDEVEQQNIGMVNKVDGLLAQIVSVVPGITASAPAITSFDNIKDSLED